jgi:16S rRNA (guanine527-N7)-methyltransferase
MSEKTWLKSAVQSWGLHLTEKQLDQFARYYEILIETNKVMNLTAITEIHEVYVKHFYDSLTLSKVVSMNQIGSTIDIGTGAGFPGIPLKIAFPHIRLVLLDSLKKRINFLQEVVNQLGLEDVECIHGRAEEWGHRQGYRESFDLVTARAVAKLNVLAEYCLPFAKVGGYFIAMKGAAALEELSEAKQALGILGKAKVKEFSFHLPEEMGERHLLIINKHKSTPKMYPRKAGIPTKQPIK